MAIRRTPGYGLWALLALAGLASRALAIIAYNTPPGTVGLQTWGGPLGLDFDVNEEIRVDELGVFDSGGNGLVGSFSIRLYERTGPSTGSLLSSLSFSSGDPGTLIDAYRFKPLGSPITLSAGFQGAIVADGFSGSDPNGNVGAGNDPATTDDGGGALSFVGSGRYGGTPGTYPGGLDGGPAARYLAGSFIYTVTGGGGPPPPPPVQPPGPVTLETPTAIRSQSGFPVTAAVDGLTSAGAGWANSGLGDNTAVFESDLNIEPPAGGKAQFTFTVISGGFGTHTLGRFRLSVTGDDRTEFADGLIDGGDVTANWTVLDPLTFSSDNTSTIFTKQGDLSLLAGGGIAEVETYTITAESDLPLITGFRLEAIEDPSLPGNGPGRAASGNFVVIELAVDYQELVAVPEPGMALLLALGGLILRRGRRNG